ncbi:MAG: hypothetical protein WAO91_06015 [Candidatus Nitrosotenuis sp.]
MNKISAKTISILALAVTAVAMVVISQTNTITAAEAPKGNDAYIFAEGVRPQATFSFKEAIVAYDFQAFTTTNNLFSSVGGFTTKQVAPEFTLQRIVGETPYLHEAVDQTYEYGGKTTMQDYPYKQFDVTVNFVKEGQTIRTLKYGDCSITNYRIVAEFDKEEGYTTGGKTGFAQMETYTFTCLGFQPVNVMYESLNNADPYKPYISANPSYARSG